MSDPKKRKADRSVSPPPLRRKVQSTTTKSNVASFFTPVSQKPPEKTRWTTVNGTLLVAHYAVSAEIEQKRRRVTRNRIAAFDMDSTLIKTRSGKKYGGDAEDWMWWEASIPNRLRKLDEAGYQVVIFSNQGGVSTKSEAPKAGKPQPRLFVIKGKVTNILNDLNICASFYGATEHDNYRKPRSGMWKEALEYYDLDETTVDMERSFYVGDAAGRQGDGQKSDTDFASSDRDFAANVGIPFHTPEEFFLDQEVRSYKHFFDFNAYLEGPSPAPPISRVNPKDIVMFCGSPGAGKSTFFWSHLQPLGYERVNQDILKSRDRCVKTAEEFLQVGKSVAIDNTNADPTVRSVWVNLAKKHNIPIRCVLFRAPETLCRHNDAVRALNASLNPEKRERLPRQAFQGFVGRFVPPELSEGFQDITVVEFQFHGDEEAKKKWGQFYIS